MELVKFALFIIQVILGLINLVTVKGLPEG